MFDFEIYNKYLVIGLPLETTKSALNGKIV